MKMDTLLVPLDGSALAEAALPRAAEMARATGARLILLRAVQAHTFPGADPIPAQVNAVRDAEAYLTEVAERMGVLGVREIKRSVWYGPAAAAIVEAAQFNHADLIVMTTHGRTGVGRLVMGSVAESVLRGTTAPILIVREAGAPIETPKGTVSVASHG